MVIVFYFVCWTPYYVFLLGGMHIMRALHLEPNTYVAISHVVFSLIYANSAINPLLYALLNRDLRAQHMTAMSKRRQSLAQVARKSKKAAQR